MGNHLINNEFQSDKYPTCPRGKVPLSVRDTTAQDLLWEYAQRRRAVDAEFSTDLEEAPHLAGHVPELQQNSLLSRNKINGGSTMKEITALGDAYIAIHAQLDQADRLLGAANFYKAEVRAAAAGAMAAVALQELLLVAKGSQAGYFQTLKDLAYKADQFIIAARSKCETSPWEHAPRRSET